MSSGSGNRPGSMLCQWVVPVQVKPAGTQASPVLLYLVYICCSFQSISIQCQCYLMTNRLGTLQVYRCIAMCEPFYIHAPLYFEKGKKQNLPHGLV